MPAYAGGERKGLAADGHVALAGDGGKMSGSYARCAGVRGSAWQMTSRTTPPAQMVTPSATHAEGGSP